DRSQRSMRGLAATGTSGAPPGAQLSTLAYTAKKEPTFRSVPRNFRATSVTPSFEKRVGSHGGEFTMRYHRTASAPSLSSSSHGFTVLPLCFDIFWPAASSTRSFTTTERYGAFFVTATEMARSE